MKEVSEQGIALISVMWFLLVMALVTGAILAGTRSHSVSVNSKERTLTLKYAAEGAIEKAVAEVTQNRGNRSIAGAQRKDYEIGDVPVSVSIKSEAGKLNINYAESTLIASLIAIYVPDADNARAISEAIVDWRDPDDVRLPRGAEALDYRDMGKAYGPRNGAFPTLGELLQVRGMTRELFACLRPDLTIYSSGGIDERLARSNLKQALRAFRGADPSANSGTSILNQSQGGLGAAYRVEAVAKGSGEARFGITAIIRLAGNKSEPFWTHSWQTIRRSTLPEHCQTDWQDLGD